MFKKLFVLFLFPLLVAAGESYNFYLLSDTHFGTAETYSTDPGNKLRYRGDVKRSDQAMPAYEQMFQHMVKTSGKETKFLIHCGDLIEGCAKGEKEYARQLTDSFALFKKHFPFPVYYIVGNHDVHGPSGKIAAQKVLRPEIARTLGKKNLKYANYTFTCGPDLFIAVDYLKQAKSEAFILGTLKKLKSAPRYLFILSHTPLIYLTSTKMADALAPYNTVIISGHIHNNLLLQYTKKGKTVTQITVSSWLSAKNAKKMQAKIVSTDKKQFKTRLTRQAEKFKKPDFIPNVYEKSWEPYLQYTAISGNGYAQLFISDQGITLLYQGADIKSKPVSMEIVSNSK